MILKPTADAATTVGYASFHSINYPPLRGNQLGQATPIPQNTWGFTGHRWFNKQAGGVAPVKNVIRFQLNHL